MGAFTENLEQEMWQQVVEPIYSEGHQFQSDKGHIKIRTIEKRSAPVGAN